MQERLLSIISKDWVTRESTLEACRMIFRTAKGFFVLIPERSTKGSFTMELAMERESTYTRMGLYILGISQTIRLMVLEHIKVPKGTHTRVSGSSISPTGRELRSIKTEKHMREK